MQTAVVVHAHLAGGIAPDDDISPEAGQSNRTTLDMRRLANRIPHALKTNAKLSIQLDLRAQWKIKPPSATINCPVIKDASSERRKETRPVMSSTVPSREMARFRIFHSRFSFGTLAVA